MYESNTELVIKQRMIDRISSIIDKLEGSLTYNAIAPVAAELMQMYIELDRVLNFAFAQTSYGTYLGMRAEEFGVSRKQGSKAKGTQRFKGTDGTPIPAGTQIQTTGGLKYITTTAGTISGGYVDISIEASEIGAKYNVPAEAITILPVQIVGVTSAINQNKIADGTDVETDAELLARLLIKVQTPSTSGNANEYRTWALSINGVGDAKVFPRWNGNATVKVVLVDTNRQPASTGLVNSVAAYIESVRPIGATVTVEAAAALTINVSVTVVRDPAYTLQQVKDNITKKLNTYLESIAYKASYVSYAQMGNAIIDSDGVLDIDFSSFKINGGTANIPISNTSSSMQTPVLGTVTVS